MRILYIAQEVPISTRHAGGSMVYYEQLASLAELGHEIHLWHFATPRGRALFDANPSDDLNRLCASITFSSLPARASLPERIFNRLAGLIGAQLHNPGYLRLTPVFNRLVRQTRPAIIWAQHWGSAEIATRQNYVPVVYSHHDWLYRVKALGTPGAAISPHKQRMEEATARKAALVVSGSAIECGQLREIGCRRVEYLPVAYEVTPFVNLPPATPTRLVHLGSLATTANRAGLERFLDVAWPRLAALPLELWVVGDSSAAPPELQARLTSARCTGFVDDLSTVLRPFDLHIIPWEHSTGQRTRLPLAFRHGQVVVAVRASVAGFPEAQDGQNCRLVDTLDEMSRVINELAGDADQRQRLGLQARHTFETHFTRAALLPRYQHILDDLLTHPRTLTP